MSRACGKSGWISSVKCRRELRPVDHDALVDDLVIDLRGPHQDEHVGTIRRGDPLRSHRAEVNRAGVDSVRDRHSGSGRGRGCSTGGRVPVREAARGRLGSPALWVCSATSSSMRRRLGSLCCRNQLESSWTEAGRIEGVERTPLREFVGSCRIPGERLRGVRRGVPSAELPGLRRESLIALSSRGASVGPGPRSEDLPRPIAPPPSITEAEKSGSGALRPTSLVPRRGVERVRGVLQIDVGEIVLSVATELSLRHLKLGGVLGLANCAVDEARPIHPVQDLFLVVERVLLLETPAAAATRTRSLRHATRVIDRLDGVTVLLIVRRQRLCSLRTRFAVPSGRDRVRFRTSARVRSWRGCSECLERS